MLFNWVGIHCILTSIKKINEGSKLIYFIKQPTVRIIWYNNYMRLWLLLLYCQLCKYIIMYAKISTVSIFFRCITFTNMYIVNCPGVFLLMYSLVIFCDVRIGPAMKRYWACTILLCHSFISSTISLFYHSYISQYHFLLNQYIYSPTCESLKVIPDCCVIFLIILFPDNSIIT